MVCGALLAECEQRGIVGGELCLLIGIGRAGDGAVRCAQFGAGLKTPAVNVVAARLAEMGRAARALSLLRAVATRDLDDELSMRIWRACGGKELIGEKTCR